MPKEKMVLSPPMSAEARDHSFALAVDVPVRWRKWLVGITLASTLPAMGICGALTISALNQGLPTPEQAARTGWPFSVVDNNGDVDVAFIDIRECGPGTPRIAYAYPVLRLVDNNEWAEWVGTTVTTPCL